MRISDWSSDVCSSDLVSDGIWASAPWAVNGPVGDDAVHTVRSVPRNSSRLLNAYQVPSCSKTLSVWETPPLAGISSWAAIWERTHALPSQNLHRERPRMSSGRTRAGTEERRVVKECGRTGRNR